MAVEALAGAARGVESSRVEPNEKKPVNDAGKVSINPVLDLSKIQTKDKSVGFESETPKERLIKLDNSSLNIPEQKTGKVSSESKSRERILFDESAQNKIFDSEKFEQRLERSVQTLNQRMEELNRSVRFSLDRVFGKDIISVVNPDSGELIRQIPPEAAMKVSEGVASLRGMLFDEKA